MEKPGKVEARPSLFLFPDTAAVSALSKGNDYDAPPLTDLTYDDLRGCVFRSSAKAQLITDIEDNLREAVSNVSEIQIPSDTLAHKKIMELTLLNKDSVFYMVDKPSPEAREINEVIAWTAKLYNNSNHRSDVKVMVFGIPLRIGGMIVMNPDLVKFVRTCRRELESAGAVIGEDIIDYFYKYVATSFILDCASRASSAYRGKNVDTMQHSRRKLLNIIMQSAKGVPRVRAAATASGSSWGDDNLV